MTVGEIKINVWNSSFFPRLQTKTNQLCALKSMEKPVLTDESRSSTNLQLVLLIDWYSKLNWSILIRSLISITIPMLVKKWIIALDNSFVSRLALLRVKWFSRSDGRWRHVSAKWLVWWKEMNFCSVKRQSNSIVSSPHKTHKYWKYVNYSQSVIKSVVTLAFLLNQCYSKAQSVRGKVDLCGE